MHARLHEGVLGDPAARYMFESHASDDLGEITTTGKALAERGFTVVIYDHGHRAALRSASDYRHVAKYWPDGRVDRDVSPT
jgi:hypothetical protein